LPTTAFPNFFGLNALIFHGPPKEKLGKSLDEIWKAENCLDISTPGIGAVRSVTHLLVGFQAFCNFFRGA
jgi:hypothetical protein